jgi:prepilin-type N-terminal cleavage/methylation domain-containing protein
VKASRRGFSLVELAVVLSVMAASVAAAGYGFVRVASAERAARELMGMSQALRDAVFRNMRVDTTFVGLPLHAQATYSLCNGGNGCAQLSGSWSSASCFRLDGTSVDGRFAGVFGATAGTLPNGGKNPYGQPYEVCISAQRVQVETCIDENDQDVAALAALGGTCHTACAQGYLCRTASTGLATAAPARLRFSYSDANYAPGLTPQ